MKLKEQKKQGVNMSSQSTLDSLVINSSTCDKYQSSHPTQKAITDAILKMVVKDVQPVQVVEHEGFKALISLLEPRYNMVSRKHLQTVLLPGQLQKSTRSNQEASFYCQYM